MRLISLSALAFAVSNAGGLGFIGAGSDCSTLSAELLKYQQLCASSRTLSQVQDVTPVGVGFLLWAGDKLLADALPILERFKPAAVWLFAPRTPEDLVRWTQEIRRVTGGKSKIWIQVGTVADGVAAVESCNPEVLVVQGTDAGGHGLQQGAGLISLLPEVDDAVTALCHSNPRLRRPALVAAGGITESRSAASALALGADGLCLGTRYLATPEANIATGYQQAVLSATDGGVTTARGKLYDSLRGTTDWPERYGGRGVLNQSWADHQKGVSFAENKKLHDAALSRGDAGWGPQGRLTTYAGAGVGLVNEMKSAGEVTVEIRDGAIKLLRSLNKGYDGSH